MTHWLVFMLVFQALIAATPVNPPSQKRPLKCCSPPESPVRPAQQAQHPPLTAQRAPR